MKKLPTNIACCIRLFQKCFKAFAYNSPIVIFLNKFHIIKIYPEIIPADCCRIYNHPNFNIYKRTIAV